MPGHGYTSSRIPPTRLDHLLAHVFEIGLSAWAMMAGVAAVFASFNDERSVSPSLDQLPPWLSALVGVLLFVGGGCIIRGLFDDHDDLRIGWRWEQAGLAMTGPAWAAFGVAIYRLSPSAFLTVSLCTIVCLMSALRFAATIISERNTRRVMK
jgi:hypothetical protein